MGWCVPICVTCMPWNLPPPQHSGWGWDSWLVVEPVAAYWGVPAQSPCSALQAGHWPWPRRHLPVGTQ